MSLEDLDEFGHPFPAFYASAKRWEAKCKEAAKQRDEAVALLWRIHRAEHLDGVSREEEVQISNDLYEYVVRHPLP
jgi:hypothetical protein